MNNIGPDHPSWPDDGSLSAMNKDHVLAGLWALDTVNPNAWPGARKYLEMSAADVVLVQEAKLRDEAIAVAEQSAKIEK